MDHRKKVREEYASGFPPPLPEGAWEKWGKDAVYFGAVDLWCVRRPSNYSGGEEGEEDEEGGGGEEGEEDEEEGGEARWEEEEEEDKEADDYHYDGVDVYAINPNDEELPVYRVAHFSYMAHDVHSFWLSPACAILGSSVYVLVRGCFWSRQIVGGSSSSVYNAIWEKRPAPCGPMFSRPNLFSLKGKLYALSYVLPSPPYDNSFELFLDDRDEWVPLEPAPLPPPEEKTLWEFADTEHSLLGLSCIGDTKVILHVHTRPHDLELGLYPPPNRPCCPPHLDDLVKLSGEQHFLLFQLQDDDSGCHGSWTRFKIGPSDSWVHEPPPPHCCPPHRSHLDIGSPLLLPVLPGKLHAFCGFGAFDSPAFSLEQVPIIWPSQTTSNSSGPSKKKSKSSSYYHESHLNTMRAWNLLHLHGTRYCAFTFEPFFTSDERQGDSAPPHCLFVCTFDLVSGNGEDQPGVNLDASHASGQVTVSAKVVSTSSKFYGFRIPVELTAGKAFSASSF